MPKIAFTARRVAEFHCPPGKSQAFLWDASPASGGKLALRATPNGKPSYIFQSRFGGKSLRVTIGSPEQWSISEAQEKAREYQRQIDAGRDPRSVKTEQLRQDIEVREALRRDSATFGEAWMQYVSERKPYWSELSYQDHLKMVQKPGIPRKNRKGVSTVAGSLWPLVELRLAELDAYGLERWAAREIKSRPTRTRLAVRLLRTFIRWLDEQPSYQGLVDLRIANSRKIKDMLGKPKARKDCLEREQLRTWFEYVQLLDNPVIAAYLQSLLLTGARREELAKLKWEDVNFRWGGMVIGDKVEDTRNIPLTPYVSFLMQSLPRRNEWVFSSPTSKSGRLTEPSIAHRKLCEAIGVQVTLHGLRRSFSNLSEWVEIPAGVVAQIMGHKPSAIAEKHYKQRPLDLLRMHHQRLEEWILQQGGVEFEPLLAARPPLKVVAS